MQLEPLSQTLSVRPRCPQPDSGSQSTGQADGWITILGPSGTHEICVQSGRARQVVMACVVSHSQWVRCSLSGTHRLSKKTPQLPGNRQTEARALFWAEPWLGVGPQRASPASPFPAASGCCCGNYGPPHGSLPSPPGAPWNEWAAALGRPRSAQQQSSCCDLGTFVIDWYRYR